METNPNQLKEILGELFSLLEAMETSNLAVLQFLKEKGIASEKEFAHFLEQAGNASSVKWRAARVRMEYLLTPIKKETLGEEQHEVKDASPKKEKETAAKESPKEQKPDNEKAEKLVADLGAAGIEKAEPKKDSGAKSPKDEQSRTEPARTEDQEKNPKKPENK
jgi:hypothetical protein